MKWRKVLVGQTKIKAKIKTAIEVYQYVKRNSKYELEYFSNSISTISRLQRIIIYIIRNKP